MRGSVLLLTLILAVMTGLSPGTKAASEAARQADTLSAPASAQPTAQSTPADPPPVTGTASDLAAPAAGARSPRNANYSIDVTLDPASRTLTGREIVSWRNITSATATDLQFHLYYNAWKNTQSTWMRERLIEGDRQHLADRPAEDWSWIDVTAIRLLNGSQAPFTDLTGQKRFISPDDGNPNDQTVMAVPLPEPVEPGKSVTVELTWTSRIPRVFARTGAIGDFFFIVQWFPKLGVFQDATGWNCHQFHAGTEFFSDYGVYEVRMTVPTGWILGATGLEKSQTKSADGKMTTHEYSETDVHDFAWTTSPDYLVREAKFEHPTLPAVNMRLLLQPEHESQAERHFAATRAALRYYGEWYGAYPYGHITIVDPAFQSGAGGMEYPTLFTAGTRWITPKDVTRPEGVTVHEAGHQFWYAIVGNNEFEDAWMDEGLNTFSTARTIAQVFEPNYSERRYFGGFIPWVFHDIRETREVDGNLLNSFRPDAKSDAQATPSYRYWVTTGGSITYDKTALWLNTLERIIGWKTLQRVMATHFERWKFKHPKPSDFFAIANEVSGQDLTWYFDQVYRSSDAFDYGIQLFKSEPASVSGLIDRNGQHEFAGRSGQSDGKTFKTELVVRRYGEVIFPVNIVVNFADGDKALERWDGRDRWTKYTYERPVKAVSAQVDPDRALLLDINYTNNSWTLEPKTDAATNKWMLKWMVWLQDLMLTAGFFV
jgi:hypothetical protein